MKNKMFGGMPSLSRKLIMLSVIIPFWLNVYSQSYLIELYDGQTINTCSGIFYDSGGAGNSYSSDENYTVTFCSDNGSSLRFDFTLFRVNFDDTLYVYDGPDISSPMTAKYSGDLVPFSLNSSGTCMTFNFKSDYRFVRQGWAAVISCCPPTVTTPIIPSDPMSCAGSVVNYSVAAHAGSTYTWTILNGTPASMTGGSSSLDIAWDGTGDVTGYVKVVEVNSCGSKDSSELFVDIYSLPVVDFSGLAASYCIYSPPVTLSGIPAGGIFTGPGISGNTFTPSAAGTGLHTVFYDYIDPSTGCSNQKAIQTLVDVPAIFDVDASANSYCAGSSVNITLSGSEPGVNYQLKVDGVNDGPAVPGSGSPLTWINKTDGVYTVSAINPVTLCVINMTGSQTITENPLPVPSFSAQPGAASCSNTDVIYITQPGQFNYIWGFPGAPGIDYSISSGGGLTDNSVTISWLSAGSKTITVNYTDVNGCTALSASASMATLVNITPPAPVGPAVQNFCSETSPTIADLDVTGTGIQWYTASSGGTPLFGSTILTDATHYFASQTVSGCQSFDRLDVTVVVSSIPSPPATSPGTGATCSQITANWTATAGADSYILDVSADIAFSSYVAGYQDLNVGSVTSVDITGLTAGTIYYYRVRALNSCGTSGNSAIISYSTLPDTPAIPGTISGIVNQCPALAGQVYSISQVPNATTYTWTVPAGWIIISGQGTITLTVTTGTPGQNGDVTVTAGNVCGTSGAKSLAVIVNPNAAIASVTGSITQCIGTSAIFNANGVVLGGGTGAWSSSNPSVASVDAAGLVTGLSAGTSNIIYTITGGCGGTVFAQQPVTISPDADIVSVTGTSSLCLGGSTIYNANGVVLGGGTGAWSSSNTAVASVDATGLVTGVAPGTCNIIYTISGGCGGVATASGSVTVTDLPAATISYTGSPWCSNEGVKPVTLVGTPGGTYSGAPSGLSINSVTGEITPGTSIAETYTVTYTISSVECGIIITTTTVTINQAPTIIVADPAAVCAPGTVDITDPLITAGSTGGLVYTYWIDPGAAVPLGTPGAVGDGVYYIKGTDLSGCYDIKPVTVTVNPVPVVTGSQTNVLCFGESNGSIDIDVTGGTAPYTFSWTGSGVAATDEDQTGLASGLYSVIVTDDYGCTSAALPVTITEPTQLSGSITSQTDVSVFGGNDGSVTADGSGGTSPYMYKIDAGAYQVSNTFGSLYAGSYTITVQDNNLCTFDIPVTITEPPEVLTGTIVSQTDVNCFGDATGSVLIAAAGGVPPYEFALDGGTYQVTGAFDNLSAGTYTVTVRDADLTTFDVVVNITQPSAILSGTTIESNVSCFGEATGSVDLTVTGGTAPYTFLWSNGAVTEDLIDVIAGSYTVIITDANGCTTNSAGLVTEPSDPLTGTPVITNVLCSGGATGSVDLVVSGGTAPYTFLWSNGATTEDITGLVAGNYTVTITDANGCIFVSEAILYEFGGNIVVSDVRCYGEANGSIDLTVVGGTAPYTFLWSNGSSNEDLTGLIAGNYSVTITDAAGCVVNEGGTVSEPAAALDGSVLVNDVLCFDELTGSVDLTVTGGTAPYSFLWTNGTITEDLTDVPAGDYSVTVTDFNGCIFGVSVTINQPLEALEGIIVSQDDITCYGSSNGSVTVAGSGGTAPYEYSLNGGIYQTSGTFASLSDATYTVMVRDANFCTMSIPVTITEPAALSVDYAKTDASCPGEPDGTITLSITGGTQPYNTNWSDGVVTANRSDIADGSYTVAVTDFNGCAVPLVNIVVDVIGSEQCIEIPQIITPNNDGYNDKWIIKNIDLFPDAEVLVFNRWGKLVFKTKNILAFPWDGTSNGTLLPTDSYHYILHLNDGSKPKSGVISIIR